MDRLRVVSRQSRRRCTKSRLPSRFKNEGFENLICGSKITMDELLQKAPSNWYIEAQQAKTLGLVRDVL